MYKKIILLLLIGLSIQAMIPRRRRRPRPDPPATTVMEDEDGEQGADYPAPQEMRTDQEPRDHDRVLAPRGYCHVRCNCHCCGWYYYLVLIGWVRN